MLVIALGWATALWNLRKLESLQCNRWLDWVEENSRARAWIRARVCIRLILTFKLEKRRHQCYLVKHWSWSVKNRRQLRDKHKEVPIWEDCGGYRQSALLRSLALWKTATVILHWSLFSSGHPAFIGMISMSFLTLSLKPVAVCVLFSNLYIS
jgi:hypothetical protein